MLSRDEKLKRAIALRDEGEFDSAETLLGIASFGARLLRTGPHRKD